MSDATISSSLVVTKGLISGVSRTLSSLGISMSGGNYTEATQTATNSWTALGLGSVGTPGLLWLKNWDTVNYVELQIGAGGTPTVKFLPGEAFLIRLDGAPYVRANSGPCLLEYLVLDQ